MIEKNGSKIITNESSIGTTNNRFYYYPPLITRDYLNPKVRATYQLGIGYIRAYLRWINLCGENRWLDDRSIDDQYIEQSIAQIREIFSFGEIVISKLSAQCNIILVAKMLGLIGEVDTALVIAAIKSKQLLDGGFPSHGRLYSDIESTLHAVLALNIVDETPENIEGVKNFVDSLQQINESQIFVYEFYNYNWMENENLTMHAAETVYTKKAHLILEILGYELNNTEKLLLKVEDSFNDTMTNWTKMDVDALINRLSYVTSRSYMFNERGGEIRDQLLPITLEIYNTLPDDSKWIKIHTEGPGGTKFNTLLLRTMVKVGRLSPALKFSITPGSYKINNKRQNFALIINNPSPIANTITVESLVIKGKNSTKLDLKDFVKTTNPLKKDESTSIPFTLNQTDKLKPGKITLKLKIKTLVYDALMSHQDYLEHEGEIEFIINVVGSRN